MQDRVFVTEFGGAATGPTAADLAAAPWVTLGTWMIIVSLLILLLVASTVALRLRLRGSWTIVVGLSVVFLYLIFRQTFAQNAELLFSPWGDAVARMAYGAGALLFAVGYARMCRQLHRERHAD